MSKEELEEAETAYAMALRDYLGEKERAATRVATPTDTTLLQLELEKAKSEEAFVHERKSLLRVTAPIGGVVTRVHTRAGDTIFGRDPIVEIANNAIVDVRGAIAPELMRYVRAGIPVEGTISTAFGCPYEGDVPPPRVVEVSRWMTDCGVRTISYGDTTGMGTPRRIREVVEAVQTALPDLELNEARTAGLVFTRISSNSILPALYLSRLSSTGNFVIT